MGYELYVIRKEEFLKFQTKLDKEARARLARDIAFLKEQGVGLGMPFSKKINKDLWELRLGGKQRVRVLYSIRGNQIYVVHWFVKKTQKMPIRELHTAISRLKEI